MRVMMLLASMLLVGATTARAQVPSPPATATDVPHQIGTLFVQGQRWPLMARVLVRTSFAKPWPLLANVGFVGCALDSPRRAWTVIVVTDRGAYALNGLTRGEVKGGMILQFLDRRMIPVTSRDDDWWAKGQGTPRMDISPLIDEARAIGCLEMSPR